MTPRASIPGIITKAPRRHEVNGLLSRPTSGRSSLSALQPFFSRDLVGAKLDPLGWSFARTHQIILPFHPPLPNPNLSTHLSVNAGFLRFKFLSAQAAFCLLKLLTPLRKGAEARAVAVWRMGLALSSDRAKGSRSKPCPSSFLSYFMRNGRYANAMALRSSRDYIISGRFRDGRSITLVTSSIFFNFDCF
jgi:hypothetical protein